MNEFFGPFNDRLQKLALLFGESSEHKTEVVVVLVAHHSNPQAVVRFAQVGVEAFHPIIACVAPLRTHANSTQWQVEVIVNHQYILGNVDLIKVDESAGR